MSGRTYPRNSLALKVCNSFFCLPLFSGGHLSEALPFSTDIVRAAPFSTSSGGFQWPNATPSVWHCAAFAHPDVQYLLSVFLLTTSALHCCSQGGRRVDRRKRTLHVFWNFRSHSLFQGVTFFLFFAALDASAWGHCARYEYDSGSRTLLAVRTRKLHVGSGLKKSLQPHQHPV